MALSGARSTGGRDDKVELLRALPWAAGAGEDDLRWLGRVADGFRRPAGTTVARAASPSRWSYVVLAGEVGEHGSGAVLLPDTDLVATTDVEVLAFPRTEEPGLHRRFPMLTGSPVAPRAHCPKAWSRSALLSARSA